MCLRDGCLGSLLYLFCLVSLLAFLIFVLGCSERKTEIDVFGQSFDFEHSHVDVDNDGDLDAVYIADMAGISFKSIEENVNGPIFEDQLPGYIPDDNL